MYQYRTTMDDGTKGGKKGDLTVEYPSWDQGTASWSNPARGPESHSMTFDVSWKKTDDSSSGGGVNDNDVKRR